jgi:hypothetical protein
MIDSYSYWYQAPPLYVLNNFFCIIFPRKIQQFLKAHYPNIKLSAPKINSFYEWSPRNKDWYKMELMRQIQYCVIISIINLLLGGKLECNLKDYILLLLSNKNHAFWYFFIVCLHLRVIGLVLGGIFLIIYYGKKQQ